MIACMSRGRLLCWPAAGCDAKAGREAAGAAVETAEGGRDAATAAGAGRGAGATTGTGGR
jgi:hypothetical protein